ncbi:MAG: alpha/beta fold hydrolase [Caldilineaceae bacterium]
MNPHFSRVWISILILAVLSSASIAAVRAQQTADCASDAVVQPGDTLSLLAARMLGNPAAYSQIVTATNARAAVDSSYAAIANPSVISVGWKLCIPAADAPISAPAPTTAQSTPTSSAPSAVLPPTPTPTATLTEAQEDQRRVERMPELRVEIMRRQRYPGSELVIEQSLAPGVNYSRYIVSYRSDGFKIYALLTVPNGERPTTGWPVVLFNHGYIPPEIYRTTERYVAYVDGFARNGYIVLRSDYRGHGFSEGEPGSAYSAPDYTVDVLNAVASIKRYPDADPNRIGMWGHSMGGSITLRTMVTTGDIKAGVIWAGVVATYDDLFANWDSREAPWREQAMRWRQLAFDTYGTPTENPTFWNSISPNSYLADLSGPIQLHHGTLDADVPLSYSEALEQQIKAVGGAVELYVYDGDNHNLSVNFATVMARSIAFFDKYVKELPAPN